MSEMVQVLNKSRKRIIAAVNLFKIPMHGEGPSKSIARTDFKAIMDFFYYSKPAPEGAQKIAEGSNA